jgi:hypothetical protein
MCNMGNGLTREEQALYKVYKVRVQKYNHLSMCSIRMDTQKARANNFTSMGQDEYNEEAKQYQDVVQVSFKDWYFNKTGKTLVKK